VNIAHAEEAHIAQAPPAMLLTTSIVDAADAAIERASGAHDAPTPCPARTGHAWRDER
jgi:hypothetical protein